MICLNLVLSSKFMKLEMTQREKFHFKFSENKEKNCIYQLF